MKLISKAKAFGGEQRLYRHFSASTKTDMEVAVFLPMEALDGKLCPALLYLSGLTCSWREVTNEALPQLHAAANGLIFIACDTSPRGENVADSASYDLGQSASFYLDAAQLPWSENFQMESYLTKELPNVLVDFLPVKANAIGITGHSMGGHGALTLALKHPELFRSVSAFAPICNPSKTPWGRKAFSAYLGSDETAWIDHDATELICNKGWAQDILIDQGLADEYLESELAPLAFKEACCERNVELTLRFQEGYDHYYHFVATFMADHMRWHAERLCSKLVA